MSSAPPASRPDVHLAYARPDAGLARAVHKYLRKAGIRVTYPDNAAADGQPWLGAADGWLSRARAHVVLLTDRTPPGWQRAEFDASARARAGNAALQTIPVVRDGYEPGDFDEVLDRFDAITLADDGAALEAALAELVERITDPGGLPAMPSHESTHPYPRLRPYGVNEARLFFGREAEVAEAVARLGKQADGSYRRWLRVEGPAGVGKASLARAGVAPAVVRGALADAPGAWLVAAFRPRDRPAAALVQSLCAAFSAHLSAREVQQALEGDGLADLVREHLPSDHGLLLVIDHLEDVVDDCADAAERARFEGQLATALEDFDQRLMLVTTARDDRVGAFEAACPRLRDAARAQSTPFALGGLTRAGVRAITVRPMAMAGRPFDELLVARVVDDAERAPDAAVRLSWLLHALVEGGEATTARYDALGGVQGALDRALDAQIDRLSPDDRARARQLLLALVQPGRGGDDVGGVLDYDDAVTAAGAGPRGEGLLELLQGGEASTPALPLLWITEDGPADATVHHVRLIYGGLPHVWGTLRGWVEADRAALERRAALDRAEQSWQAAGKADDALPDEHLTAWLGGADLPGEQRQRLRAGLTARLRRFLEAAEASAARRRERDDASRMASQEAALQTLASERDRAERRKARLRLFALVLVAVVCALTGLTLRGLSRIDELQTRVKWADGQRARLREQLREAEGQLLAAEKQRLTAETERRQTERLRRLSDREGLLAERSADDVLSFSIQAANKADDFFERIPHPDAKYARRAYAQDVLQLLQARLDESPDNERLLYLMARQHLFMAQLAEERNALREVQPAIEAAIGVVEDLHRRAPDEPDYQEKLANAYERLGEFLAREHKNAAYNDFPKAIELFGKAIALHRSLAELEPDTPTHPMSEAKALAWRGEARLSNGQADAAREDFAQAMTLTAALVEKHPTDPDLQDALARRTANQGDVFYAAEDYAQALPYYEKALAIAEKLGADEAYETTRRLLRRKLKFARILAR